MSGRNRGYLNSNPEICQVETEDIRIAVLLLRIFDSSPKECQVGTEDI